MKLASNLRKLNLFKITRGALIVMPIIVLFYQDIGLSLSEIFLLQSIFAGFVMFLEIPTGYLGDMLSRKTGLVLGSIVSLLGRSSYMFVGGFRSIVGIEFLLAVGLTLYSGSDTALLYDTLLHEKKADEFKKRKGTYLAYGNFSEAGGALLGGWLATFSLQYPFIGQICIAIVGLLISMTFVEPPREKHASHHQSFSHLISIIQQTITSNKKLTSIILYSACTGCGTMFRVRLSQPFFKEVGLPLHWFGIVWAVGNLSVGIFSVLAHHIEKHIPEQKILPRFSIGTVLGLAIMGLFPSIRIIPFMFIFYGVRGISNVIYFDMMNSLVSSKERATLLSLKSLSFRGVFMVFGPFIGWIGDVWTLQTAFIGASCIVAILCGFSYFFMKKYS